MAEKKGEKRVENSFRDELEAHIISEMRSYTNQLRFGNYYGYVKKSYGSYHTFSPLQYVCYYYLNNAGDGVKAISVCSGFRTAPSWPYNEQNLYFEYMLDPERSPWRQLLSVIDYDICRNKEGLITGLIVYTTKVNRWYLAQFLKGFRQIIERGFAIKVFTETVKRFYDPSVSVEYTEEQEEIMTRAFYASQLFAGSENTLTLDWGHEHKNFHGLPVAQMLKKEILGFDKNINKETFFESSYFVGRSLHLYAFGQPNSGDYVKSNTEVYGTGTASDQFTRYRNRISAYLNNARQTAGRFFTEPTNNAVTMSSFATQDILRIAPEIMKDFK